MNIIRYSPEQKQEWNTFLDKAKNTTFLFNRGFIDYHKDRFRDHSLMVYNRKNKLIACLPANEDPQGVIWTHQGLTYGGLVFRKDLKLLAVMEIFRTILHYYSEQGFKLIRYKAFPRFYNDAQTDEIEYCLFLSKAKLYRRDTALTVDRMHPIQYSGNIRREARKAQKKGVVIDEDINFEDFWFNVLTPNLKSRFNVKPVHSVEEISLLKSVFPDKIKLYTAKDKGCRLLAGTVFFLMNNVAHCQYISANNEGRSTGALNLLFVTLLNEHLKDKRFFDLGTVNEDNGRKINTGLLAWKERMGGRTYSHDFYEIITAHHTLIGNSTYL